MENLKNGPHAYDNFLQVISDEVQQSETTGRLTVEVKPPAKMAVPCTLAADAQYRGPENQLYRIEIHKGGTAAEATWKWSRENGSVVFPIVEPMIIVTETPMSPATTTVSVDSFGRDERLSLKENDWVEIVDDDYVLRQRYGRLLQVKSLRSNERQVVLAGIPQGNVGQNLAKHPLLRRWDQQVAALSDGVLPVLGDDAVELEHGLQCKFQQGDVHYATGAYWNFPAHVATGGIELPETDTATETGVPAKGVTHSYAPLAHVWQRVVGSSYLVTDLRNDTTAELTIPITPWLVQHGMAQWKLEDGSAVSNDKPAAKAAQSLVPLTLPDRVLLRSMAAWGHVKGGKLTIALKQRKVGSKTQAEEIANITTPNTLKFDQRGKEKRAPIETWTDNSKYQYFIETDLDADASAEIHDLQLSYQPHL